MGRRGYYGNITWKEFLRFASHFPNLKGLVMTKTMLMLVAVAVAVCDQAITATWSLKDAGEGMATTNGGTLYHFEKDIGAQGYSIKVVYSASAYNDGIPMVAVGNSNRLSEAYGGTLTGKEWYSVTTVYAYEGGLGV